MKLGTIGYNYEHEDCFLMDRPEGTGCGVMLLIKENTRFCISNEIYDVRIKSMVVFSPETPYYFRPLDKVYRDDWMYFTWEDGDREMFEKLSIPLNVPIALKTPDELSLLFKQIAYEHYSKGEYNEEVTDHYLKILLYKLSWNAKNTNVNGKPMSKKSTDGLLHMRTLIYDYPEDIKDAGYYADALGMSMSGFQHAYKKLFGVNLMTDINNSRFAYAKQLLQATNMPLKEIAVRCGYESEYSFMRQFKKITGVTPTEFRKQI